MNSRDELISILDDCELISDRFMPYQKFKIAEHLLNYGIIVPPCTETKDGVKCKIKAVNYEGDSVKVSERRYSID